MRNKSNVNSVRGALQILCKYDAKVKTLFRNSLIYQFTLGLESLFWNVVYLKFLLYCINNNYNSMKILFSFFVICAGMGVIKYFNGRYELKERPVLVQDIEISFRRLFYSRIISASILEIESTNYNEKNQKIIRAMQSQIIKFLDDISILFGKIITTSLVFIVIWGIDKRSLLILIFPVCATWFVGEKYNKKRFESEQEQVPGVVRKEYVKKCFFSKRHSAEIRMTHISRPLIDLYDQGVKILQQCIHKNSKARIKLAFSFEIFKNRIPFSLILAYVVYQVMIEKKISVIDISVVLVGLVNLSDGISQLIEKFVVLGESKRYIYDFESCMEFYDKNQEVQGKKSVHEFKDEIRFENVEFSYGNNQTFAYRNINFTIQKGEKIAIVGENGAGKTTLIHLLLRIYNPMSGRILLNGSNILEYRVEDYRNLFTVMLQDSKLLSSTIAENILCNQENEKDERLVEEGLKFADIFDKVNSFPHGIHSVLTKEFDDEGINLSGGELQRIAIARAYIKKADIMIFDEPTSAIDPLAEEKILNKLYELSENKTAIFIMHRMSFATKVDKILVMDNGKIIEQGNHWELMKQNGKYAKMYQLQAEKYKLEE